MLHKAVAGSHSHIGAQEQVLHGGGSQVERVPAEPMRSCSERETSSAGKHMACASQLLILALKTKILHPAAQSGPQPNVPRQLCILSLSQP